MPDRLGDDGVGTIGTLRWNRADSKNWPEDTTFRKRGSERSSFPILTLPS